MTPIKQPSCTILCYNSISQMNDMANMLMGEGYLPQGGISVSAIPLSDDHSKTEYVWAFVKWNRESNDSPITPSAS